MPGQTPGPDQIIASNTFGLAAMLENLGAHPRILPIARDTESSLRTAFDLAKGADLVITIGGASVGDHDLVAPVAAELGDGTGFLQSGDASGQTTDGRESLVIWPWLACRAIQCLRWCAAPCLSRP